jgi:uncharacterized membrane protein YhhN
MKTKYQYLLLFYWIALLADCYFIYSGDESNRWATKGMLMPLLMIYYLANSSRKHHLNSRILTIAAFLLAWGGDIVLLNEGQNYFIAGLALFLAMHIIYIIYLWRMHRLFPVSDVTTLVLSVIMIVGIDLVIFKKLIPLVNEKDPGLATPIMCYMGVVSLLFIMAFNILTSKKAKSLAFPFFIPGAALFILSDALLGFNIFLWNDHVLDIGVMLTYGYAQYLLVHGFIKHIRGRM